MYSKEQIIDIITQIDAATHRNEVTNIMVARVLQWLLQHTTLGEDQLRNLDARLTTLDTAVLVRDPEEEAVIRFAGVTMQVINETQAQEMLHPDPDTFYVIVTDQ